VPVAVLGVPNWISRRIAPGLPFRQAGASIADPRWRVPHLIEPAAWSVNKIEAIESGSSSTPMVSPW
jgi:hypothetical protein